MKLDKLLRFATMFCSLAAEEEQPPNAEDTKTILSNLEKLETYAARKKYAEENLEHLSSGSSRIVYLTKRRQSSNLLRMIEEWLRTKWNPTLR